MGTKTKRSMTGEAHQMLELLNSLGGRAHTWVTSPKPSE